MRTTHRRHLGHACAAAFALALVTLAAGCGDDGGDPGADAPPAIDAPQGVNALGQLCAGPADCPASPAHTCVFLNVGNQTQGYCSPVCAAPTDCTNGYQGPATGTVDCYTPNDETACSIACEGPADCPATLSCVTTGGPFSFCTVPP